MRWKFKPFLKANPITPPLNPREAFFGGRTNAVSLHYQTQEDEEIRYFAKSLFCSDTTGTYAVIYFLPPVIML